MWCHGDEFFEQLLSGEHGVVAECRRHLDVGASDDRTVEIGDHADERPLVRQVEPDHVVTLTVDVEQRCWLAGARVGAGSELDHEAVIDETRHDPGDRHPAEAELPCEVGAGATTVAVERLEHERAVVMPGFGGADSP